MKTRYWRGPGDTLSSGAIAKVPKEYVEMTEAQFKEAVSAQREAVQSKREDQFNEIEQRRIENVSKVTEGLLAAGVSADAVKVITALFDVNDVTP